MTHLLTWPGLYGTAGYYNPYSLLMDGAAHYLSRTPGSAGDRKKWTVHIRFRQASFPADATLFAGGPSNGGDTGHTAIRLLAGQLYITGQSTAWRISNRFFRDTTKFCPGLTVQWDTANATAALRCRAWWGLEEITWATSNTITQNQDGGVNNNTIQSICAIVSGVPAASNWFHGSLCEFYLVDGELVDPSAFVREDASTEVDMPKPYKPAVAGCSTRLRFLDATSTTTLGYDDSGNSNHWTLNSMATTDRLTDGPANCHAIWSVVGSINSPTISEGGLRVDTPSTAAAAVRATFGTAAFKFGFKITAEGGNTYIGVQGASANQNTDAYITSPSVFYRANGQKVVNGAVSAYGASYTTGDVIEVLVDPIGLTVEFKKNGVSQGAIGLPAADTYFPCLDDAASTTTQVLADFGQAGYVPSDPSYKTLSTKNLPTPSIRKASTMFRTTLDTESNIYSAVASARAGWTDCVDILKNRDATESWAWQFSHDSSNEYAISASTSTRQAKRAMSGSDKWVGYSIRIGAAYGTAAGSVAHNNGAATTITHNLNKARCAIFLFRRGGNLAKVYHPDLTAGELLDLTGIGGDTPDTTITGVGANSFQISSGAATDTYDYLVLGESDICKLVRHIGNGTDGPLVWGDIRVLLDMCKRIDSTGWWSVTDAARSPYNLRANTLAANAAFSEADTASDMKMDFLSGGLKVRETDGYFGGTCVHIMFGDPFKTANAA